MDKLPPPLSPPAVLRLVVGRKGKTHPPKREMADADDDALVIQDLENETLETLRFDHQNIGVMTGYAVCVQIRTKPTITSLCIDRLMIGYHGIKMIADELAVNTTVRRVSMCGVGVFGHPIGAKPWTSILLPLSKCQSLTELDLSMNGLMHEAKGGLCVLLRDSPVQKLTLPCWSDKLNEALLENTSLRHLKFFHLRSYCFNLPDILPALISPRCTLQSIDLYEFRCDEDSLKQLAEYYKAPATFFLQELNLRNIRTTMADAEFIQLWIDVMRANEWLAVLTSHGYDRVPVELIQETSDLLAQEQRKMQTEMPRVAHVAVKRARTE